MFRKFDFLFFSPKIYVFSYFSFRAAAEADRCAVGRSPQFDGKPGTKVQRSKNGSFNIKACFQFAKRRAAAALSGSRPVALASPARWAPGGLARAPENSPAKPHLR